MDELRRLQKERERERRRLRDRQRRQSMSAEERERHLSRRRRNYQLRRQRAEIAQLGQRSIQNEVANSASDVNFSNIATLVESAGGQAAMLTSLEIPPHKLAKFSGKLRLNHLKQLARSFNDPGAEPIGGEAISMNKGNADSRRVQSKGVRLNRVKQLARGLNSALKETVLENHQVKSDVEQNLQQGVCQPPISDVPSSIQSENITG